MNLKQSIKQYDSERPLARAETPPSLWYTSQDIASLEYETVFKDHWLYACDVSRLKEDGDYFATIIAGQPVVLVRKGEVRAFYNVCRHHAAQVMSDGKGCARAMHCPYHGWTYDLTGQLTSTPKFDGVENFDKSEHGLVPIKVSQWQNFYFVHFGDSSDSIEAQFGYLNDDFAKLELAHMRYHKSVAYELDCNWKVFVDNYLDGGYHVPFLHKGLSSALDNKSYEITTGERHCLQSCATQDSSNDFSSVRSGTAYYYWLYPNLMLNWYAGIMDLNIVQPVSEDKCRVIFEYYFDERAGHNDDFKEQSIAVAHQIQQEDLDVCHSVQRGLKSRAYDTGRLSVVKEAGEHLFHRLLHADLSKAV